MGISYDPVVKKWKIAYEKTDHKTDRPISQTVSITRDVGDWVRVQLPPKPEGWENGEPVYNPNAEPEYEWQEITNKRTATVDINGGYWDIINALNNAGIPNPEPWEAENALKQAQVDTRETNKYNEILNQKGIEYNARASKNNNAYNNVVSLAGATRGGDYVQMRDQIRKLDIEEDTKKTLEEYYKTFYRTEKLQSWDLALGSKPQYGNFDPKYYKEQNPEVAEAWKNAVANDDIDITERYGENGYYLQHYTAQGKPAGKRGNPAEETAAAKLYKESAPTDRDLQDVRNLQLGIDSTTQTDRLINVPEIAAEWEKAKNGDPYWSKLAKEKFLNPDKKDEFAALFRLSDRPEDKQVSLKYNINAGYGVTELEDALNQAVGERATVDVKRFGALAQNVLKDTIAEMKKAKQKEQMLGLLNNFDGFAEISNINKELTSSILGDTGVGGMLSFTSGGKAGESLEKNLQNITGVNNNVTYNWQQWFDTKLKDKYNDAIELGYSDGEAEEMVKVDGEFARNFIDKYLTPRFNTSRSMDEFVEYLDVRQKEQNPFQTQDMVNAATLVAELRAKSYLDQLKNTGDRYFDSEFYFNPTGDKARENQYLDQAKTVSDDWEAAKRGDTYWAQQAYRFGVDVNNKEEFARMHFQVKGQGRGYDGAEDILNAGKVQDEIYGKILPALKEEALKQGTIFGQFIKPEEFADELLKGLDPNDKQSWNEVLKRYGITDFKGTVDELKDYVAETLRTGSAQKIKEEIKYLNEKRQKPTQEKLGLTYIERPEDYKDTNAKPETELYKVFQSAGFKGTEDDFYNDFFPDLDRSEQALLTKSGSNEALKLNKVNLSDPFASLGTIESFFDTEEDKTTTSKKESTSGSDSYFKLDTENEEDQDYKSKTGQQILGEFTSMFKGL
jgi:hypothetical protein